MSGTEIQTLHLTAKEHKVYVSGKLATEDKAGNIQARTLEKVNMPNNNIVMFQINQHRR